MSPTREPALKRAVFLTSGSQIIIQIIGVLTGVFIARWLGPTDRGELATIITWVSLFAYMGNLGLPVAFAYSAAANQQEPYELLGHSILMATIKLLILGLVGSLLLPLILSSHDSSLRHLAVLYLWAYLPLNLLTLNLNAIQQGVGDYSGYNAVRISVVLFTFLFLLGLWGINAVSVKTILDVYVIGNLFALLLTLWLVIPKILKERKSSTPLVNFQNLKKNIRYGLNAQIGTLKPFSGLQVDVLALTLFSSSHETGLYMVAIAGANLLKAQAAALGQVVFPEVAKRNTRKSQWRIIKRFMLIAAIASIIIFVIVILSGEPLIRLVFGKDFVLATSMLQVLVAAGSITAIYQILADGLRGMGLPKSATHSELAGLIAGSIALIILVPSYGGQGAAIAALIASLSSGLMLVWLIVRQGLFKDISDL